MRIELGRLTEQPLEASEDIDAGKWDLDSFDVKFIKNIHIDCKFRRSGKDVFVHCSVLTHRLITCSRCLGKYEQEVSQDFNLSYPVSLRSDYLEIDSDLREEVLLNFPMKVLCKPDCRGICPRCGVNLNIEECRCKK